MVHEINSSHMTLISEIDEDDLTSKKTFSRVSLSLRHDFYLKMLWFGLNLQKDEKFGRKFFRTKFLLRLSLKVYRILFSAILLHTTNSLSYYHLVDINFSHYNLTTKL